MMLRTRVALTSAVLVLVGVVLAVGIGTVVLLDGYHDLEAQDARDDLERATAALATDVENLGSLAFDWSGWDDTFAFVKDPADNAAYLDSNLVLDTYLSQRLNLIVITDGTDVVYASAVDLAMEEETPAGPVVDRLREGGMFAPFDAPDGQRTGIVAIDGRLLEISTRAVTNSTVTADPVGTFTMARWLSDDVVAAIAERIRLDVAIEATADAPSQTETPERTVRGDTLTLSRSLAALGGEPVATISVRQPRTILAQGLTSVRTATIVVAVVLVVAAALLVFAVDRQVLRPLRRLQDEIAGIGGRQDVSGRVSTSGRADEIGDVARHLNDTLGSLERAQQQLEVRNVALQHLTRDRQRFMSVVSHDLRTPLTAVQGFAKLLSDNWEDLEETDRRDYVRRIDERSSQIEVMIGDLLALSQVVDGRIVTDPVVFDVAPVLAALVEEHPVQDGAVRVTMADGTVRAVPDHLRRIVSNLVENARKYGAPPIELSAVLRGEVVEVRVTDHGEGVPVGFEERLFESYSQAQPNGGSAGGVGLGLSIVRELSAANGGAVRYEPVPGGGACFVVELPAADPGATAGQEPEASARPTGSASGRPPVQVSPVGGS